MLADLARASDSVEEIVISGGVTPLVSMLGMISPPISYDLLRSPMTSLDLP